MTNFSSREAGSSFGGNKIITLVIVAIVAVGFGYFLFKLSPEQAGQSANSNYKLDTTGAKQIALPTVFDPSTDRFKGSETAKNVFIEYSDFQCPACAAFSGILKDVPTAFKDTVFVYRNFPLEQIHKNAVISALAAEAAGEQGKFWEMHDMLFQNQTEWQDLSDPLDKFAQYAVQIEVPNIDQFKSDITSKKHIAKIQKDNNEALGLSLPGTPSLFFNGHQLKNGDLASLLKQAEEFYIK